jgi:hypothetical protein
LRPHKVIISRRISAIRSGWSVEALINIADVTNSSSCLICSHTKTESKITADRISQQAFSTESDARTKTPGLSVTNAALSIGHPASVSINARKIARIYPREETKRGSLARTTSGNFFRCFRHSLHYAAIGIAASRNQALQLVTEFLRFEATQFVHIIMPFHR